MTAVPETPSAPRLRALAPLADRTFRSIWSASLLSNLGQLVLGVAAAWEMTRLTSTPEMVALVQTALMLPLMLVAVPAGAFADMFDRRRIALAGLCFAAVAAAVLSWLAAAGLAGPWVLLGFCFLIGGGVAFYGPSWQASIAEQVPAHHLPAAVALGSVSYNIARSFGPALGGVVVLALGANAAFGATALLYLPLIAAFFFWRREHVPPRLPPERIDRAIISGIRYAVHAAPIRAVMIRVLIYGFSSASLSALSPLVAKQALGGDASTYGLILCATGVGAVIGALFVSDLRERFNGDRTVGLLALVTAAMLLVVGLSHHVLLTAAAMMVAGATNMLLISLLNVAMQFYVPRWVAARALAWFQSSLTGGLAFGAWFWGDMTGRFGLSHALEASAALVALTPLFGRLLPMIEVARGKLDPAPSSPEPDVALAITGRSGPVIIEVDYRVEPEEARAFYDSMLKLQRARLRNGAFGWSLSRDIGDAAAWTERFEFPTWQDYLRHRERFTQADRELQARADAFNTLDDITRVRRRLERPLGSVRWQAATPAPSTERFEMFHP